jgi:Flp pilus assembly protein TadG
MAMRRYFQDENGVGTIEFALIAPFLSIVLLGTISGWVEWTRLCL